MPNYANSSTIVRIDRLSRAGAFNGRAGRVVYPLPYNARPLEILVTAHDRSLGGSISLNGQSIVTQWVGKRWGFCCPLCSRSIRCVYRPLFGRLFACRMCHHLRYYSNGYNYHNPEVSSIGRVVRYLAHVDTLATEATRIARAARRKRAKRAARTRWHNAKRRAAYRAKRSNSENFGI